MTVGYSASTSTKYAPRDLPFLSVRVVCNRELPGFSVTVKVTSVALASMPESSLPDAAVGAAA